MKFCFEKAHTSGSALLPGEKSDQHSSLGVSALNPVAKIVSSDKVVVVFMHK